MSFLFGNAFKGAPQDGAAMPGGPPPAAGDDANKPQPPKKQEIPGVPGSFANFDPSGLERAAKAMKELNQSKHAQQALDISKKQEDTRQLEFQAQIKEYEAHTEQIKLRRVGEEQEQHRKTLQAESEEFKKRSQYEDQLARRRYDDQLAQQNRAKADQLKMQERQQEEQLQRQRALEAEKARQAEDQLKKQEESVKRQEAMRRATIEHEAQLRHKHEMERIEAKVRGKAQADRENREINLEKLRAKAVEDRATALETIERRGKLITEGITNFITDWEKVSATVAGLSLLALGVYSSRGVATVATRFAEARIGKPKLVRETSRLTVGAALRNPIKTARRLMDKPEDVLQGIVFKPTLATQLRDITVATANTRTNRGMYRNLLFYGPPGTGKTLFAKSLARRCKMDYAIMTGGDILPMGAEGVTAIHKVFDWAKTSRRGLLLFVDEADAFLKHRSTANVNEDLRSALNAFLYRTGEQSDKFMLVLATNKPSDFDRAIEDRMDDMLHFGLPDEHERQKLVEQYFERYVVRPVPQNSPFASSGKKINLEGFKDISEKLREVAVMTEGFSGREISKLAVSWQASAFANADYALTQDAFEERTVKMMEQHEQKKSWVD
ncbi:ATPase family AAA domain-containing protein 3-like [Sycon ciliatum]|uniref:ATPase family AAA domain-containing protein 3-like n=1 Tax=Sycon ciliatum TaxID=27933 RepID=UPI0031F6E21F